MVLVVLNTLWQHWSDLVTSCLAPSMFAEGASPWHFTLAMIGMILIGLIPACYTIHQADKANAKFPMRSLLYAGLVVPAMMIFMYGVAEPDPTRWERKEAAQAEYDALVQKYHDQDKAAREKLQADKAALQEKYEILID